MNNDKTSPVAHEAITNRRSGKAKQKQPVNGPIFGRTIKRRICLIALVTTLVSTSVFGQTVQRPDENNDYFYANGKRVPVVVSLDRIAVIGKDQAAASQVASLVNSQGLVLTQELSGGVFILRLQQRTDRAGILKLVRDVRKQGEDFLRDVGLVVQVERDNNPSIVTDEFIAKFKPNVGKDQIDAFNQANGVTIVRREPFVANQFLLRVTESSPSDALRMANRYQENQLVVFSHPNFWSILERNEIIPNDALFGSQWHHRNTGGEWRNGRCRRRYYSGVGFHYR